MKHVVKICLLSLFLAVFVALGVFLSVWFFGADYSEFDAAVQKEGAIPGLESGISPQGLCPMPKGSGYRFAMSGYLKGEPSRVYFFGGEQEPKFVTLKDEKGDIDTHFGGITCTGNYLVVASGKQLVRFSLSEALGAENGAAIVTKDAFKVEGFRSIAYCYFHDGMLYAGEFYRPGNYETDESHHITENGETNFGIIYAYKADENAVGGVNFAPEYAISVREQVQGFAVWENGIALSTSYGLPDSQIFFYENILKGEATGSIGGVPLYRLDSSNCTRVWKTPCMSEEIFEQEGRLYLLFESKSKKYKTFVRRQIPDVLSVSLG